VVEVSDIKAWLGYWKKSNNEVSKYGAEISTSIDEWLF